MNQTKLFFSFHYSECQANTNSIFKQKEKVTDYDTSPSKINTKKTYDCSSCSNPRFFASKYELNKHFANVHKGIIKCSICDKNFSQKHHLKVHMAIIHEGKSGLYQCDICNLSFDTMRSLNTHKLSLHSDKSVSNTHNAIVHEKEKLHQNSVCNSGAKQKTSVNVCIDNRKKFKCHFCDESYSEESSLKNHIEIGK